MDRPSLAVSCLLAAWLVGAGQLAAQTDVLAKALDRYLASSAAARREFRFAPNLQAALRRDPETTRAAVWAALQRAARGGALHRGYQAREVRNGELRSPYTIKEVGKRPRGGWPLFIAMHGGGGVPKRVNDSQWRHMQIYYRDQKSVAGYKYLALRAPTDQWNGFYTGYIYPLVQKLLRQFLLFGDVDPDRVFLLGYSHGGYGAFAIGPTMADRFAAVHASAAAPTGVETQARNLRNTVFSFMVGERDTAHGRAARCQAFAAEIAKLRGTRRDAFPVRFELQKGFGHGGLPDRDKIATMYPAVRRTAPRELSWSLGSGTVREHFWLQLPQGGSIRSVDARIEGNTVHLAAQGAGLVELVLDRRHLDLRQPVELRVGEKVSKVRLAASLETLCESMERRGDPRLAGTVRHRVTF